MILEQQVPVITIDGPSGTGKGTICHLLAQHLGWHVLDSGCIYRVLALAVRKKQIVFDQIAIIVELAHHLDLRFKNEAQLETMQVLLEGQDVSEEIRTEQCGQDASKIAAIPEIRSALLERQRAFAQLPGLVTDGRDMGTVVFPWALLKFYLHASLQERAQRRYLQLKTKGIDASLAEVVDELEKRDTRDTARSHAPLAAALDAIMLDTTGLTIVQVFENVLKYIPERLYP